MRAVPNAGHTPETAACAAVASKITTKTTTTMIDAIHAMRPLETLTHKGIEWMRVPGGWVLTSEYGVCFVPYHPEFRSPAALPMLQTAVEGEDPSPHVITRASRMDEYKEDETQF